jgi:hypothetical protein
MLVTAGDWAKRDAIMSIQLYPIIANVLEKLTVFHSISPVLPVVIPPTVSHGAGWRPAHCQLQLNCGAATLEAVPAANHPDRRFGCSFTSRHFQDALHALQTARVQFKESEAGTLTNSSFTDLNLRLGFKATHWLCG